MDGQTLQVLSSFCVGNVCSCRENSLEKHQPAAYNVVVRHSLNSSRRAAALLASCLFVALAAASMAQPPALPRRGQQQPSRPPAVPGELIVRLRSDFPACAHCLLEKGAGLKSATGTYVLDQVRLRHGITAMEPVFGGVHAAARRQAAQQRFGRTPNVGGGGAGALSSRLSTVDVSQTYRVHVDPKTDLLALAAEFRRDPNVVSAEPNYLYKAQGTEGSRQRAVGSRSGAIGFLPLTKGGQEGFVTAPSGEIPLNPPLSKGESDASGAALPNDPFLNSSGSWGQDFPDLWGLFQIHAPEAWELSQGERVIVAVIDTGIDIAHPDLAANVWHNTGEIPGNGIDDDGNGYVDDVDGWDFTTCKHAYADGSCIEAKMTGPDVIDEAGHGTHIAGTIAAVGDNGIGIIGVAPKAQVMAVKGLDAQGQGRNTDLATALVYAAENGAKVINTSWSGPPSDTIKTAIDYVTATFDVVVVASAGNDAAPLERGYYPANLPNVLAVGATTHIDESASFSNFGGPLDLVAPGGGDAGPAAVIEPRRSILSLVSHDATGLDSLSTACNFVCCCHFGPPRCGEPECENAEDRDCSFRCVAAPWVLADRYVRAAGTSFAAPHVAGTVALVRSRHPEFTQSQVRQVLRNTADDLGPPGWDERFGYGGVDARRAVEVESTPVAEILAPENRGKIWERNFPFAVVGTVAAPTSIFATWRLTVRPEAGGVPAEVAGGSAPIADGVLGTLDLGGRMDLQPGQRYVLDLEAKDTLGRVAHDSKMFLIPNPQFAAIPVPDPFDEGGFAPALCGDGRWLAVTRSDREPPNDTSVWLFDAKGPALSHIARAGFPHLSATGGFLLYGAEGRVQLRDLASGSTVPLSLQELQLRSIDFYSFRLASEASRVAFVSNGDLDPSMGNVDGTAEVFELDRSTSTIRQLTNGPPLTYPSGLEVQDLAVTPDGKRLAFSAQTDLDQTATAKGVYQAFLYNDDSKTVRQLSGRSGGPAFGLRPTVSADGALVAFESEGIFVADACSGSIRQVVGQTGYPTVPLLSADGTKLAFASAVDLDPSVTNEDLSPEIFLLDLLTGSVAQVTDTINFLVVPYDTKMDATAATFLVATSGELNGTGVQPPTTRWVKRRARNRRPLIRAPREIVARELETSRTVLRATDPDGDPVVFYAQRVPPYQTGRLRDLAGSELRDHGDGSAELLFTPRYNEAGTYPLRIAAFDDGGDVDVQDVTLVIEDTYLEGDANCDGRLSQDDTLALVSAIFDPSILARCPTADADGDGRVAANDLAALAKRIASQ